MRIRIKKAIKVASATSDNVQKYMSDTDKKISDALRFLNINPKEYRVMYNIRKDFRKLNINL